MSLTIALKKPASPSAPKLLCTTAQCGKSLGTSRQGKPARANHKRIEHLAHAVAALGRLLVNQTERKFFL
jgi:hypothetical protein